MMLYQSHLNGRAYLMIITGEDLMKFSPPDGNADHVEYGTL